MTVNEALTKAMKLCSLKEYAPFDMEQKLLDWGISEAEAVKVVNVLKEEKFLDEFRMAKYFVNDKLKFNKWGRVKIKYMLVQKKVSIEAIDEAILQIDDQLYQNILFEELAKKRKTIKDTNDYQIKAKLFQFASGRGFAGDEIYRIINIMK
jgi:regulatory protein